MPACGITLWARVADDVRLEAWQRRASGVAKELAVDARPRPYIRLAYARYHEAELADARARSRATLTTSSHDTECNAPRSVASSRSMLSWVVTALERPLVIKDTPRTADAIVVLGGLLGPNTRLSAVLAERVDAAAELWRAGLAPIVIATGGVTSGTRAEADVMAEALAARGVAGVIVERRSRSTAENARFTAAQVGPDIRVVWLVTQPFHGRRAARLFRRAGFEPLVWHIEDSIEYRERRRALKWVVREYAAWGRALLDPKR